MGDIFNVGLLEICLRNVRDVKHVLAVEAVFEEILGLY